MKRKGTPLVLGVALLVLAGAWLLAESTAGRLGPREEEAEVDTGAIVLSAAGAADVKTLSWSRGGESVSLTREEETGAWVYTRDPLCPLDRSAVEFLVAAVGDVTGLMSITGVTDFAQYGLEEPMLTLTVETTDHTVTYQVGDRTITGEYYLRVDGTDTVYTEDGSLQAAFDVSLAELVAMESPPEDIFRVEALTVTGAAENYELLRPEEDSPLWYGSAYEWYVLRKGETSPVAAEKAMALWGQVAEISFLECVDWHEEHFRSYGLDVPQAEATLRYTTEEGEEKTFVLRFGRYAEDLVYVNIAGSEQVYLVAGTVPDELMYPDWAAMTPLTVCPVDLSALRAVTVALGGHTYEMEIFSETTQEVDTEGNIRQETTEYYVANGWTLDRDGAASWLASLAGLTAESLGGESRGREELLSVTFHLENESWPEVTLSLWSYDSARCLCLVNGEEAYFILRTQGETLVTAAEQLLMPE